MLIGFSKVIMDFPSGLEMAGYVDRERTAEGKHDDLEVFCVYLDSGSRSVSILVYDILGVPEGLHFDIDDVEIVPVATHTHSAPKPSSVIEDLKGFGKEALKIARNGATTLKEMIVRNCTTSKICDLRDREESVPIPVRIIEMHSKERRFAILIYACHPTILGPENLLYSSDLAGALRRRLSEKLNMPVIYMNSCCGNISTYRTRRERSFEEVERLSKIFVDDLECFEILEYDDPDFEFFKDSLELKVVPKKIDFEADDRALPGLKLLKSRRLTPEVGRIDVSLLKIGDLKIVFEPCELFYETCGKFEDKTIIVNYANGYRPYLVPKGRRNTYEWIASPYPEDSEERFVNFVRSMVEREGDPCDGLGAKGEDNRDTEKEKEDRHKGAF